METARRLAAAELGHPVDQVLEGPAVAVEGGEHQGVPGVEEGVACLELRGGGGRRIALTVAAALAIRPAV
ncbi:hypothetical protein H340_02719 [Streptomyces mobaraensis NBRC 13819 = DSM 40847]|uniref:Uncharacterized protein n=1 Tax=Streptomyces mobaraensis (strain ATCC 29032 / DSM 40847 / JCM 4168 / NBRC 13819 / NCIMB 11159 / IPCR 16-22) TaxID=1223523 RepID=M3CDF7_STRM1|nr:hypothetical protein H340_02719 [Streptomyces mobaraensis NBRC 13819 = DSM 40847]